MEGFFRSYLRLYRPIITELNEVLRPYGLSYSLWQVIYYIKTYGASTLVNISDYYKVEKPSITRRGQRLEELGMIRLVQGANRREKIIQLTDLGEETFRDCRKNISSLEKSIGNALTNVEWETLNGALEKLNRHMTDRGEDTNE